jgi:hypothetical protein
MTEKTRMIQAPWSVKPSATVSETVQRIAKTHASWRGAIEQLRFNIHSRVSIAPRQHDCRSSVSLFRSAGDAHWMAGRPVLAGACLRGALSVAIRFAVFIYSCYSFVLEFLCVNFFTHLSIRANVAMDQARTAALTTAAPAPAADPAAGAQRPWARLCGRHEGLQGEAGRHDTATITAR